MATTQEYQQPHMAAGDEAAIEAQQMGNERTHIIYNGLQFLSQQPDVLTGLAAEQAAAVPTPSVPVSNEVLHAMTDINPADAKGMLAAAEEAQNPWAYIDGLQKALEEDHPEFTPAPQAPAAADGQMSMVDQARRAAEAAHNEAGV